MQMPKLLHYASYKLAFQKRMLIFKEKGKRPSGKKDSQSATGEETFSIEQFVQLVRFLLACAALEAGRDLSCATMMFSCCGRSDDILLLYLPDIIRPRLIKSIGEGLFEHAHRLLSETSTGASEPQRWGSVLSVNSLLLSPLFSLDDE